jgi:hypothetical protein
VCNPALTLAREREGIGVGDRLSFDDVLSAAKMPPEIWIRDVASRKDEDSSKQDHH